METVELCYKAADVPFLIVAALQCFSLTSSTSQKSYQVKDVSCLVTAESHLERNALILATTKLLPDKV